MAPRKLTPENIVKRDVKSALKKRGWFYIYMLQSMGCQKGISDHVYVKDKRVIWVECKSRNGKQSKEQRKFEQDIKSHGGEYFVIRGVDDLIYHGLIEPPRF